MRVARWTASILALVVLGGVALVLLVGPSDPIPCSDPFDRRTWDAAVDDGGDRHLLAEQLARCRLLAGRSQREVWRVLGRPGDGKVARRGYPFSEGWRTGRSSAFIDDEYLLVRYDRRLSVSGVELTGG